jgi:hypothetical protein
MDTSFDISNIVNAIDPIMVWLYILAGYIATDKLYLQDCMRFMHGKKSIAVFLIGLPIALAYLLLQVCGWESVLLNFFVANVAYDYFFKHLKPYLP